MATSTRPTLEIEDLHVWFDRPDGSRLHAVRGASLGVAAGFVHGLVGESGSGKSTIAMAALGLLPPTASVSGAVRLDGVDIMASGEASIARHRWKDLAVIFQGAMNAFNPVLPIRSQISEAMRQHDVARGAEASRRSDELLIRVGIPADRTRDYAHQFSGGMRQRAAIALALACNPKIVIADEPTSSLDVIVQARVIDLLCELADETGIAVLLVTHDLPLVAESCDTASVMYAGEIVESSAATALFESPRHPYTRSLLRASADLYSPDPPKSIPGGPPRLDQIVIGCPFEPRCPSKREGCATQSPITISLTTGEDVACLLYEDQR